VQVHQETSYPWDSAVKVVVDDAPASEFTISLRIPGWASGARLLVNGEQIDEDAAGPGTLANLSRAWKKGDAVELMLPMQARLVSANPKVEECRGQVAVMRGPVVYCAESVDLPEGVALENVAVAREFQPTEAYEPDLLGGIVTVTGKGHAREETDGSLYRDAGNGAFREISLTLIPYFAWRNRGRTDMTVWMPVS